MKLFLDAGAFIARAWMEDRYHAAARAMFDAISSGQMPYRQLYTSNFVVDEVVTFLLYEAGARVAVETLSRTRASPTFRVLHVTEDAERQADEVFHRYASSRVSYTACTTKVLMEREGIDTAFSFGRDIEVLGLTKIP